MQAFLVALLLALILTFLQFFGEQIYSVCGSYYTHILSLSAGISITYLFLDLIPQFSDAVISINRFLFLSLLIGFVVIHLIEKYIYQHSSKQQVQSRLGVENQITSFTYHFILGMILFEFATQSLQETLLLFVPIAIFTAVSTLPVHRHPSAYIHAIVSSSTVLGVLVVSLLFTHIDGSIQTALLGFIIGGLLFSIIRHSLPFGTAGKPFYFLLGIIIYAPIVIITSWIL